MESDRNPDQNPNRNPQESVWIPTRNPCGFRPESAGIRVDSNGIRRNPWSILIRKNRYLVNLLASRLRETGGRVRKPNIYHQKLDLFAPGSTTTPHRSPQESVWISGRNPCGFRPESVGGWWSDAAAAAQAGGGQWGGRGGPTGGRRREGTGRGRRTGRCRLCGKSRRRTDADAAAKPTSPKY